MDLITPDDVAALFSHPSVVMYWPTIVGLIVLFVALVTGHTKAPIPIIAVFLLLQAWRSGWFA